MIRPRLQRKVDSEAGKMVFRVGEQAERALVGGEDVADEQKPETLALGLRGEERREKLLGHGWRNALTIVGNNELERSCRDGYGCVSKFSLRECGVAFFILHS